MKISFPFVRRNFLLAGGILVAGLALTACNKSNNDDNGDNNPPAAGLMAFNLAPDKPAIAVGLSGNALTSSPLAYGSYTGGYIAIYTGNRTVEAYDDNTNTPFATTPFDFAADKYYSTFLVGNGGNYSNVVVRDNFDSLSVTNGESYVRFINAIADSTSSPQVTIAANGSNVVDVSAPFASVSEFAAATPGDVSVKVSNGGTIDATRTITLETKKAYTVLLTGVPGVGDGVQIKFIANGNLTDSTGQRTSSSARSVGAN